jgi:L-alanine-DL-glutamate epimerase-like enolase superfamily enzyme
MERRNSAIPPEACESVRQAVTRFQLMSNIVGRSPLLLEALLPDMPAKYDWDFVMLREGLSIALYDLAGKLCGAPAHALLGGRRRDRVPGMPVIHTAAPDVMARRAKAWTNAGYRYIKIKPPGYPEQDLEALRLIRKTVGPDIKIQVDWNQVCPDLETAEQVIRLLSPVGIDLFEDILAGTPLDHLAELRRRTGARFMVDREASWSRVFEVCRKGAADVINQHPNNQGGLGTALQIAAVAAAAGIPTAIGSSGNFTVQNTAFQALSSVIGVTRPCEDIGVLPYYSGPVKGEYHMAGEPSVVKAPYPIVNGEICIPDDPGLGIELDRARLQKWCVKTLSFKE